MTPGPPLIGPMGKQQKLLLTERRWQQSKTKQTKQSRAHCTLCACTNKQFRREPQSPTRPFSNMDTRDSPLKMRTLSFLLLGKIWSSRGLCYCTFLIEFLHWLSSLYLHVHQWWSVVHPFPTACTRIYTHAHILTCNISFLRSVS